MNTVLPRILKPLALAATTALTVSGCYHEDTKDSDLVGTNQTFVFFSVTGRASGPVYADVQLREGGAAGAALRLVEGDSLWFSSGQAINDYEAEDDIAERLADASQRLTRMEVRDTIDFQFLFLRFHIQDTPYYTAALDPVPDNRYYLGYLREELSDATGSYVSLPTEFDITAPMNNESVNRNNDIVVNWETNGDDIDQVTIVAALVCNQVTEDTYRVTMPDDLGTYTLTGGTFAGITAETCPLSIEITKQRFGTQGTNINGGEILGQRVNTVTVSSTE